eukprot:209579-Pleurochrysis_carterae.AAC.1
MRQQSARAAISANSVHGARRATYRPGHCLTQARCVLRHESAGCAVWGKQTNTAHATAECACNS